MPAEIRLGNRIFRLRRFLECITFRVYTVVLELMNVSYCQTQAISVLFLLNFNCEEFLKFEKRKKLVMKTIDKLG